MVNLQLGQVNTGLLKIAAELAERLNADIIGIAACQPTQMVYGESYVSGDLIEKNVEELNRELKVAEHEFRDTLQAHKGTFEWRHQMMTASISDYVAHESRCADLIITSAPSESWLDSSRSVNTGDLIMRSGRPILIVPTDKSTLPMQQVLVAWKDTREARRAVYDALPLLGRAAHVAVIEIADDNCLLEARRHLRDVLAWLKQHSVIAESIALNSDGDNAKRLQSIAQELNADLIVAGAYGHSRMREWTLGGVTRDYLLSSACCALVSH